MVGAGGYQDNGGAPRGHPQMQPPMDMRMGPQARAYMGGVGQNPYMMDQRMGVAAQPGMPPNSMNVAGMPGPTFNGKPAPGYTPEGFQNPGMMYGMNTMHVNNGVGIV